MKKYTLTALVLMLIAGICAALIASVNLLTAPIIEKTTVIKQLSYARKFFPTMMPPHPLLLRKAFHRIILLKKLSPMIDLRHYWAIFTRWKDPILTDKFRFWWEFIKTIVWRVFA